MKKIAYGTPDRKLDNLKLYDALINVKRKGIGKHYLSSQTLALQYESYELMLDNVNHNVFGKMSKKNKDAIKEKNHISKKNVALMNRAINDKRNVIEDLISYGKFDEAEIAISELRTYAKNKIKQQG
jgi:hypothetical protein